MMKRRCRKRSKMLQYIIFVIILSIVTTISISWRAGFFVTKEKNDYKSDLERYFEDPYNFENTNVESHLFPYVTKVEKDICAERIFLLIYIHSAPDHFARRNIVRRSWGNIEDNNLYNVTIRRIFMLGYSNSTNATDIQKKISLESEVYKDIVQFYFLDSYFNLTIKAINALKWSSTHCRTAQFILKTDDDTFVNMFTLLNNLESISLQRTCTNSGDCSSEGLLICDVWSNDVVARQGKWSLPLNVWSYETWPDFCPGLAYIMTGDVASALYNASFHVPLLWLDDVFVTGFAPMRLEGQVRRIKYSERFYDEADSLIKHIKWSIEKMFQRKTRHDLREVLFVESNWQQYIFFHAINMSEVELMWNKVVLHYIKQKSTE